MSSVNWFEDDSRRVLREMGDRNCVLFIYIGKENDELTVALNDPMMVELLNDSLLLCFKMDPDHPRFMNFQQIFYDVAIPSVYVLEKGNIRQFIVKEQDFIGSDDAQLNIKLKILNSIDGAVKCLTGEFDNKKLKHMDRYLALINKTIKILSNAKSTKRLHKYEKETKSVKNITKLKIKIPCEMIVKIQEFPTGSTLNDVKDFVLNYFRLPKGTMKLIAHREFVEEDFCKSLEALNLSPSSTIYVHLVPSDNWVPARLNLKSWIFSIFTFTVLNPYNFFRYHAMNFIGRPQAQTSRMSNSQNVVHTKKKSKSYKPGSNIHRLRTNDSDNDENNTYNGNSTQQL